MMKILLNKRLDRAMANKEWCKTHNGVEVAMMTTQCSDHKSLLVNFSNKKYGVGRQKKGFKFEHSWTTYEERGEKIKVAWNQVVTSESP